MESKRLSKIISYRKELKKLLNKDIVDIILFGSFVKGGFAEDIDIAIIVRKHEDYQDLKKEVNSIIKNKIVDIQIIDIESIYQPIWITLIKEGFSVQKNKFFSEIYKIKPVVLYKYSLGKLNNVQKVQFERGLKRILEGIGQVLTRSVILVPVNKKNEIIDFLKTWNIYYESQEYELLPVLRKEELF